MRRALATLLFACGFALPAGGVAAESRMATSGGTALDAVAHAVQGAESSYGTDPRMWRPGAAGPQGPMQVSAAAAQDVGGGNRFDPAENLILGRAYLAQMYRRFGSWPDAVAAYDWGPGRLISWIRSGRPLQKLPFEVARYRARVLLASNLPSGVAVLAWPAGGARFAGSRARLLGVAHPQPRAGRRSNPRDPVNLLYAQIMAASETR